MQESQVSLQGKYPVPRKTTGSREQDTTLRASSRTFQGYRGTVTTGALHLYAQCTYGLTHQVPDTWSMMCTSTGISVHPTVKTPYGNELAALAFQVFSPTDTIQLTRVFIKFKSNRPCACR